jgi:cobalamin-dependent methionine synthase I
MITQSSHIECFVLLHDYCIMNNRLVEAFAEALHADIRRTLWGFAPDEKVLQLLEFELT